MSSRPTAPSSGWRCSPKSHYFAALVALGPPGSLPPCNPVLIPISNIGLAGAALHAAVESGRLWEWLAPALPQLLSFLRGLHSLVSLAAEAVPSEGRPLQQRRSTEQFAGSQGQQAAAAASHSSHGLAIWSDTHTSKAWHDIIGQLVHMLHDVASSPLPQTAGTASSTLATAAKCVEALLRLAPLLPRLPLPTAALGSGGFGGYVVRCAEGGDRLPLSIVERCTRCAHATVRHGLLAQS